MKFLAACVSVYFCTSASTPLFSAVYQWSVPLTGVTNEGHDPGYPRAFLWIPPGCKQVRAVVLAQNNMQEESILEDANFRKTLASTTLGGFNPKGSDQGPTDGDLAPFVSNANDYVPGDFEKQFLAFNRLSNLVTVRSDSFTAYVLVQGWRNAGTATPELVVQRRAAFIADRSASTPSNLTLNVTNIPANN